MLSYLYLIRYIIQNYIVEICKFWFCTNIIRVINKKLLLLLELCYLKSYELKSFH